MMRSIQRRAIAPRRGVTLIEMLVTVALLVLVMTILVLIFRSATGAVQTQRIYAALDQDLRRFDATLRQDLRGITAKMTPPNNPNENTGYFEYAENCLADPQGEDTDDTLRFTAKAPEGQPFTGRVWVVLSSTSPPGPFGGPTLLPITMTSQYAEIIYFLRHGNLYRRVLLILPQPAAPGFAVGNQPGDFGPPNPALGFATTLFRNPTSAVTRVSWQGMNDISARPNVLPTNYSPIANTLGDLTNRENRFASPRFANDYINLAGATAPDGIPDDTNSDGVPDYYPTLYAGMNPGLLNENPPLGTGRLTPSTAAFPFLYPGAYSNADSGTLAYGALHTLDPTQSMTVRNTNPLLNCFYASGRPFNHAPVDPGDSLPIPTTAAQSQTWWGFPTWRETMSPNWIDPIYQLNDPNNNRLQAPVLRPVQANGSFYLAQLPLPIPSLNEDPYASTMIGTTPAVWWNLAVGSPPPPYIWEDDLILTNVRSFDVKAFDPNPAHFEAGSIVALPPGYYDLGYDNLYNGTPPLMLATLGHEGRIPPLTTDNRADPQYPLLRPNVGDDNPNILRMRRVYDTWSTAYTNAPALPVLPFLG
ncbi:MAG: prepilin-type N-terminal cleavage/methylation domain-containing protein, partial [Isosphaeraceae bacterium]|nr:prepilin-type N-terminal cleavage/methylation domain-containing protein [Isosphaeraceae bacterium]